MGATTPPDDGRARSSDSESPTVAGRGLEGTPSSLAPEDLSGERVLKDCPRIDFANGPRPSIGRIAILARLGRGGMGVVYYGVNPRLGTEVAVKILPSSANDADGDLVDRFVREARIAAKLRSDHLVGVLDVDRDEGSGHHFLVMEYVRGRSAGQWMRGLVAAGATGAPEDQALDVVIAATKGLAAAHFAGVVHRDVKPDNILIPADAAGRLQFARSKLADLGLARVETGEQSLTGNQSALGTPGYMAPEQAKDAKRAKKPADVFGMGATLHALLAGMNPFAAPTPMETLLRTLQEPPSPVRLARPDVSDATAALIAVCLASDPANRYPDASALLEALELCRSALAQAGAGPGDAVPAVRNIAQREEVGAHVRTDGSARAPEAPADRTATVPPAAGVATATPARKRPKWLIPASVVVVAAAVLAFDFLRPSPEDTPPPPARVPPGRKSPAGPAQALPPDAPRNAPAPDPPPAPAPPKPGDAAPVPSPPSLSVTSRPPGAEVLIDGRSAGRTPLTAARVEAGEHDVTLRLAEHADLTRKATFAAGRTTDLGEAALEPWPVLDLTQLDDSVTATVLSEGGSITLAPGKLATVAPGKMLVVLARDGFAKQRIDVDGRLGATIVVAPSPWEPLTGTLDLSAFPADARIEIDGKAVAPGAALKPGTYTLRVLREGYEPREVKVAVDSGGTARPAPPAWAPDAAALARVLSDVGAWDAATPGLRRAAAESVARRDADFALRALETFSAGGAKHEVAVFAHARTGLEFVLVPPGKFAMGSAAGESGGRTDEAQHTVTLTQAFLLARTECTQEAYERVAGANPSKFKGPKRPVEQVSWTEAAAFCAKAGLALPTEAQWEWACRAGTTTRFTTGADAASLSGFANVLDRFAQSHGAEIPYDSSKWTFSTEVDDGFATTAPAGSLGPNAFGLFDVHGNVWEWCADGYDAYAAAPVTDPAGAASRPARVYRGGSWFHPAGLARSAVRSRNLPDSRDDSLGFRPAKAVAPK